MTQAVIFPYFQSILFKFFPFCVLEMNIWSFPPWTCHWWAFEAQRHCIVFVTLRDIQEKKIKLLRRDRTWNGKQCVQAVYLFRGLLCFKRRGRTMFGGTRVVRCLHFWKWLSALMFVCVECVCWKNDAADGRKITFFLGFFTFFAAFSCASRKLRARARLCVCVCVCSSSFGVCAVATCGVSKLRSRKDIWALTAFQLMLHLSRQEDETW